MENKEIEEEHEFMRARIKELENKPTYPFNEAFNKQLQEENAKLKQELEMRKANEQESDEFWDGVFDKEIQNDYETNKNNLPQIIEEFMSNNLLDMQNDEGYTIPVFIQVENKLEILEDLEQECEYLKKQHEQYKPFYELGAKCTQLNEVADGLSNKCDKYKQALNEIEKFIKKDVCDEKCGFNWKKSCSDCDCRYNNILDIISKAKEL